MKRLKIKKSETHSPPIVQPFFNKNHKSNFFHKSSTNSFFSISNIQTKLKIGQPKDKYEQEAERMENKVMNIPKQTIQKKCKKELQPKVQKKTSRTSHPMKYEVEGTDPVASSELTSQLNNSKGKGTPLPKSVNQHMGNSLDANFEKVRVHTGSDAIQMNQGLNARAFTHGSDIYFNKGEYSPNSSNGKRLLAHELTHVIQQNSASTIRRVTMDDCNKKQKKILQARHNSAQNLLGKVINQFPKKNPSKKTKAALRRWFGIDMDSNQFGNFKYFNSIKPTLESIYSGSKSVTYECDTHGFFEICSKNKLAVALYSIHLCPEWWKYRVQDQEANLIHEWGHKYGKGVNRIFETYCSEKSKKEWDGLSTLERLQQPDAYAGFVMDMGKGTNACEKIKVENILPEEHTKFQAPPAKLLKR